MGSALFDVDQAIEILDSFNRVSGLGCTLYAPAADDMGVAIIYTKEACKGMCPHCSSTSGELWRAPCQRTHAVAARFADRFGGRYFYQCREDRIFFAAPVVADGGMVATMTIGPVHIYDVEEAHSTDPNLRSFPVRKPAYIQYLSNLLTACAVCVSDASQTHLRMIRKASNEQQSELNTLVRRYKHEPFREYPISQEETLAKAIRDADATTARLMVNEVLGILLSSSTMVRDGGLRQRVDEIKTVCGRAAIAAGASTQAVFEAEDNYSTVMKHLTSNEELCLHLQTYVEHMVALVERLRDVEYQDDVYRAIEYIRVHYAERLTLEDVANHVGFSPSYFSRLFKRKMGTTFSAYLNDVRIDESKTALLSTDLSASVIARRVGYEDASYFTRVFKKITGVSPGYYRSHRGRYERAKELG